MSKSEFDLLFEILPDEFITNILKNPPKTTNSTSQNFPDKKDELSNDEKCLLIGGFIQFQQLQIKKLMEEDNDRFVVRVHQHKEIKNAYVLEFDMPKAQYLGLDKYIPGFKETINKLLEKTPEALFEVVIVDRGKHYQVEGIKEPISYDAIISLLDKISSEKKVEST